MKNSFNITFIGATLLLSCLTVSADPPSSSGVVMRGDEIVARCIWGNAEQTNMIVVGSDDPTAACDDFSLFDVSPVQYTVLPDMDDPRVIYLRQAKIHASVWPNQNACSCSYFRANPGERIATATGQYLRTYNDFTAATLGDTNNAYAHGYQFDGRGLDADGNPVLVHFLFHETIVIEPNSDEIEILNDLQTIKLDILPRGN